MFNMILKYLRSGYLVEEIPRKELLELQVEAEYYQLTSLMEIIKQRLVVEDEVSVIYRGQTFKCKPHALQYCVKELIDQNGDFNARDDTFDLICTTQRNACYCYLPHEITMEDLLRRLLRRLEDNRVGEVEPPRRTELWEDSYAAIGMGLLPVYHDNAKWFY